MTRRFTVLAALLAVLPFFLFGVGLSHAQNVSSLKIEAPEVAPTPDDEDTPVPAGFYRLDETGAEAMPVECPQCVAAHLPRPVIYRHTAPYTGTFTNSSYIGTANQLTVVPDGKIEAEFFDEEGDYHEHKAGGHTLYYECARGHQFHLDEMKPYCWCGWPDKGPFRATGAPSVDRKALGGAKTVWPGPTSATGVLEIDLGKLPPLSEAKPARGQ